MAATRNKSAAQPRDERMRERYPMQCRRKEQQLLSNEDVDKLPPTMDSFDWLNWIHHEIHICPQSLYPIRGSHYSAVLYQANNIQSKCPTNPAPDTPLWSPFGPRWEKVNQTEEPNLFVQPKNHVNIKISYFVLIAIHSTLSYKNLAQASSKVWSPVSSGSGYP